MINRRDFLKTLATGGAMLSFATEAVFSNNESCFQGSLGRGALSIWGSPTQLPIWKDVDVLVVGATSGGIAAAISAAKRGASVFVISSFPYPGEDICGSFLFWPDKRDSNSSLFKQLFPSKIAPYPLHVKSVLEKEMINNGVGFLYSSYATHLIVDDQNKPAGVCIANRSGNQAIRAKVIIDATHHATIARQAGIAFHPFKSGKHTFRFTVIGSNEKKDHAITRAEKIYPAFNVDNKSIKAIEYTLDITLRDSSYASLMEAEQKIRDITWDINQGDCSDIPYYIPSDYMKSMKPFESDEYENFYVLGPCSSFTRQEVVTQIELATIMESGEVVGVAAAEKAAAIHLAKSFSLKPTQIKGERVGNIKYVNQSRPIMPYAYVDFKGGGVPVLGEYDIIVVGGGTAGAPAAISASREGAKVLLLEYLHGLGGIGTYGYIGRYTAGYRSGFTAEVNQAMQNIAPPKHERHIKKDSSEWPIDWKAEWYRQEIRKANGDIWFHALVNGVYMESNGLKGVVVNTPFGQGVILCSCVIDSTGSADVAIAAGASFEYTGRNSLAIQGAGLSKFSPFDHYNNTDWTFVDDTDIVDVTRLFIQAKAKNQGSYDVGKLPQTRERRRIIADYNVSVFDMINKRTYRDTISYHKSNFDTHGFTEDIFFTIKPPEHSGVAYDVKLPLRSLLPKGLSNILVTGLGSGVHRDAMPVVRMQPDLQNQGYAVGLVASEAVRTSTKIRKLDMKRIQKKLIDKGNLPKEIIEEADIEPVTYNDLLNAVNQLPDSYNGLEIILADRNGSIPLLTKAYEQVVESDKVFYANVLCMVGEGVGWKTVLNKVKTYVRWDKGWNYRGMHQFGYSLSKLDNYVIALGYAKHKETLPELNRLAGLLDKDSEFSHIRALSIAYETIRSKESCEILYSLLLQDGMMGHFVENQKEALSKVTLNIIDSVYVLEDTMRNKALKELFLAKSLYLCGDKDGLGEQILQQYATAQEAHYARFAWELLSNN